MILFLFLSIYFVLKNKWVQSATFLAIAIQIKLIPLMLIPFFFKKLKWFYATGFTILSLLIVVLIGGVLWNEAYFSNMMLSVNEYFIRFQFNAGIFNIVRWIGFEINGWDPIQFVGPILSSIATIGILVLAAFKAFRSDLDIVKGMLFAFVIYYSFSTTVHPWYISLILAMSIFTKYNFGLIWSVLIMLSYYAYSNPSFQENYLLIFVEYFAVYSVMIYEIVKYWKKELIGLQLISFLKIKKQN
jgi:hypothetical protein